METLRLVVVFIHLIGFAVPELYQAPIKALESERQAYLDQRVVVEKDLGAARSGVEGVEAELRRYEAQRQRSDHQALTLREALGARRLQEQAVAMKAQALVDAVSEAGLDIEQVIAALPEQAEGEAWRQTLAARFKTVRATSSVRLTVVGDTSATRSSLKSSSASLHTSCSFSAPR